MTKQQLLEKLEDYEGNGEEVIPADIYDAAKRLGLDIRQFERDDDMEVEDSVTETNGSKKPIQLYISEDLKLRIQMHCLKTKVTMSSFLRNLIETKCKNL